jgi:hypothetical protein
MWTGFEKGPAGPLNRVPRTSSLDLTLPLASESGSEKVQQTYMIG